ncbi:hypothetical protein P691DRAFT_811297 [Macrolepiota fuliginosa MF-IS2]|uniref:Uncharacterized protein n=1 Tax=Macrolepiota fuliginosa MF-IS2 TaxID=1400762 RepID=A0A9P6BXY2_9AGAR|nr:hypothetical protein P691DRAFT_811297 [Macrolepiota fuliginosa MF-IS2]
MDGGARGFSAPVADTVEDSWGLGLFRPEYLLLAYVALLGPSYVFRVWVALTCTL